MNSNILSNVVSSQIALHAKTGGVVPEVASRAHVESIRPVIREVLSQGNLSIYDVRAIAVCNRPGLIGCLSVGVSAAKALAISLKVPLIGIHHLEGHLLSPLASGHIVEFPHIALLVSGGHTELILVRSVGTYEVIGQTIDDAAGEAFDKSARLLGFSYPGGRDLSELAESGDPLRYRLPQGLEGRDTFDFSFSGLKTAVRRLIETEGETLDRSDAAASIQYSIVSVLVSRAISAAERFEVNTVTLSGGVASNQSLRKLLAEKCSQRGLSFIPALYELCMDNAAMIGIAAAFRLGNGEESSLDLDCYANSLLPIAERST
jgi:N6-L-threonylcarbamoyladenine synthase